MSANEEELSPELQLIEDRIDSVFAAMNGLPADVRARASMAMAATVIDAVGAALPIKLHPRFLHVVATALQIGLGKAGTTVSPVEFVASPAGSGSMH